MLLLLVLQGFDDGSCYFLLLKSLGALLDFFAGQCQFMPSDLSLHGLEELSRPELALRNIAGHRDEIRKRDVSGSKSLVPVEALLNQFGFKELPKLRILDVEVSAGSNDLSKAFSMLSLEVEDEILQYWDDEVVKVLVGIQV